VTLAWVEPIFAEFRAAQVNVGGSARLMGLPELLMESVQAPQRCQHTHKTRLDQTGQKGQLQNGAGQRKRSSRFAARVAPEMGFHPNLLKEVNAWLRTMLAFKVIECAAMQNLMININTKDLGAFSVKLVVKLHWIEISILYRSKTYD